MTGSDLQGTVRAFDTATCAGDVMLDDGTVRTFDDAAYAVSGLRLLRPGQRVRLRTDPVRGTVTALTLATFPWPDRPAD